MAAEYGQYQRLVDLLSPYVGDAGAAVIVWSLAGLILAGGVLGIGGIMSYVMRKIMARIQTRRGPNRVGPFGLLQFLADGVKLISKEDVTPARAEPWTFRLAPFLVFLPVVLSFAPIPWSSGILVADLQVGLLFILAISAVSPIGEIAAGWASNNKYSMMGALRAAVMDVSYEVPLVLSAVSIVLLAGSVTWHETVPASDLSSGAWEPPPGAFVAGRADQGGGLTDVTVQVNGLSMQGILLAQERLTWFALLMPVALFIFFAAALAKAGVVPNDLPESESELVAGYFTEYSGMRFGVFFTGVFVGIVFISALTVTLFFGGWTMPFLDLLFGDGAPLAAVAWFLVPLLGFFFFLGKTAVFVLFVLLVWFTLPRMTPYQLLNLGWKVLFPLSLVNLAVTVGFVHLFRGDVPVAALAGVVLTLLVLVGLVALKRSRSPAGGLRRSPQ